MSFSAASPYSPHDYGILKHILGPHTHVEENMVAMDAIISLSHVPAEMTALAGELSWGIMGLGALGLSAESAGL